MANLDRIERYSKIRAWIDAPIEQRPTPHQILNQMLTEEQALLLRLTNSNKPWALVSKTLTTVAGQSEYEITQPIASNQNSGKVYYIIRTTNQTDLPYISVPFDDFSSQNYGQLLPSANANDPLLLPELVSIYRKDAQSQKQYVVIQPAPQSVLTYTIYFKVGSLNRSAAAMTSTGPVSELNDWLDLTAAIHLLPYCEWKDDENYNDSRRRTLAAGLADQIGDINKRGSLAYNVDQYLRTINSSNTFDLDYWDD